jgi:hypothetical protein
MHIRTSQYVTIMLSMSRVRKHEARRITRALKHVVHPSFFPLFFPLKKKLYSAHVKEALHKAEVCLQKAVDLKIRAARQLRAADNALACCSLTHTVVFRMEGVHYVRALLAGIIAVSGVTLLTLRDPEKRRRIFSAGSRIGRPTQSQAQKRAD